MPFGMMIGLGRQTVCYVRVTIPEGEVAVLGGNVPYKPNTANDCDY